MWFVELTIVAAMIAINSIFAAYEIALASLGIARLQVLVKENRPGAKAALYMKENMEASLAVVQLGITLVGAIAAATSGAGAEEALAPYFEERGATPGLANILAIALVVVPLTAVTIMFGELVPKVFALRHKEWVCLKLSPPMRLFGLSVWPAVWLFETGVGLIMKWGERAAPAAARSEAAELQELRALAGLARASRLIGPREEGIINSAARLSTRPVREIVLPPEHISTLPLDGTIEDALIAAHMDMHTRFPVIERAGDPQSIVGYVNFKDIVAHMKLSPRDASLRAILRPLPRLGEDTPLSACMESLIRERSHIALVCGADGAIKGMITMEDILEELVGDIQDEYDRLPTHTVRTGTAWVVGGGVTLRHLHEQTGVDLAADGPGEPARTLNDWVVGHLRRPARGGDILDRPGGRVLVRKVRRQKVLEAHIRQASAAPAQATP